MFRAACIAPDRGIVSEEKLTFISNRLISAEMMA